MSAPKKAAKPGHKPPEGRVRLGQVVMTFGPGAMVDLLDHAVLVGGTDFWRYDKYKDQGFIDEPRLRDTIVAKVGSKLGFELSVNRAFRLPPAGDDDAPNPYNGIQVAEFPSWFVCKKCRALGQSKNLEREKGRYVHHCSNAQKGVCVPVRFVATCKRGHLDEFPWSWFVHPSQEQRCEVPDLYLEEDASGDFAHIVVHCKACDARRKLSEAREPEPSRRPGRRLRSGIPRWQQGSRFPGCQVLPAAFAVAPPHGLHLPPVRLFGEQPHFKLGLEGIRALAEVVLAERRHHRAPMP